MHCYSSGPVSLCAAFYSSFLICSYLQLIFTPWFFSRFYKIKNFFYFLFASLDVKALPEGAKLFFPFKSRLLFRRDAKMKVAELSPLNTLCKLWHRRSTLLQHWLYLNFFQHHAGNVLLDNYCYKLSWKGTLLREATDIFIFASLPLKWGPFLKKTERVDPHLLIVNPPFLHPGKQL